MTDDLEPSPAPGYYVTGTLAHRVAVEGHGVLAAGPEADEAGHVLEELIGIEVAAEAVDVCLVLPQRGDAGVNGGGDVHEMGRVAGADHVGVAYGLAARPGLGEDPLVGRIPAGVQHGEPDRAMVGVVDRALAAPGQVEAHRDDHLGLHLAERGAQVTP